MYSIKFFILPGPIAAVLVVAVGFVSAAEGVGVAAKQKVQSSSPTTEHPSKSQANPRIATCIYMYMLYHHINLLKLSNSCI